MQGGREGILTVNHLAYWQELFFRLGPRKFGVKAALKVRKELVRLYRTHRPARPISDGQFLRALSLPFKSPQEVVSYFARRERPAFLFATSDRTEMIALLEEVGPGTRQELIREADAICAGHFHLLGVDFYFPKGQVDWHRDPVSGQPWPKVYWSCVDYGGRGRNGEPNPLWKLARHQYFVTLGAAYWATGHERYVQTMTDHLLSWIEDNPPEVGLHWTNVMEFGVRLLSWTAALYLLRGSESFQREALFPMLKSLYQQMRFLRRHLTPDCELHLNNHSITEAAGLVLFGTLYPEFKEAAKWRDFGLRLLAREVERQVYSDGVDYEMTTAYHRFVVDLLLAVVLLSRRNHLPLPPVIEERLERMLEVVMHLTKPDGLMPTVGDTDDGRGHPFGWRPLNDHRSCLAVGAVLFGRGDFKAVSGGFDPEAAWLLGPQGLKAYEARDADPPQGTSHAFPDGGFCVMRSGWDTRALYLIADCGYLGMGPRGPGGHGHNDLLSFELYAYGRTLVVDPGTYTYMGADGWRNYFRSTAVHNTAVVDGREMADFGFGLFSIRCEALPRVHSWTSTEAYDMLEASHSGYERLSPPITHRRQILFMKGGRYFLVRDQFIGTGEHTFDLYFHLAPVPMEGPKEDFSLATRSPEGANLMLRPVDTELLGVEVLEGWVSPSFGVKVPAPVIRHRKRTTAPASFTTVLYPLPEGVHISSMELYERVKCDWRLIVEKLGINPEGISLKGRREVV